MTALCVASCASRRIERRTDVRTGTDTVIIYKYKESRDTVLLSDSFIFREKGDTVYVEKIRWRTRSVVMTDTLTLYKSVFDTIYIEKETERAKEKRKAFGWFDILLLIIILILLLFIFAQKIIKRSHYE